MNNKQLYEKQSNQYNPIFPLVRLEDIIETISDKSIQWILNNYNHIYVEYSESVEITRNKVPSLLRRNGLWITYNTGKETITEYHKGSNNDVLNYTQWTLDDNWERFDKLKYADGSITYQHLSDAVKQLLGSGNTITNYPDDEDLTVEGVNLKLKDREYDKDNFSGLGRVILRKNIMTIDGQPKNILSQAMINKENTIYEIRYDFDLNGNEITIPEGCVLQFEGGSLNNGTVIGNNTSVNSQPIEIFININIKGEWLIPNIYFEWFKWDYAKNADNTYTLRSLFSLQNPNIKNNIFIPEITIWVSVHYDNESYANDSLYAVAILKSNTSLFLNGTIKLNTFNNSWYSIFYAHGEHINIIGNGHIIGDFATHIPTGESATNKHKDQYGFGIYYCGVKNGVIKGITCNYCWGSGIRIDSNNDRNDTTITLGDTSQLSQNIYIVDVICKFNRREGIIVEGALDTEISHCEISYTGYIDENKTEREFVDIIGTKYGIDIEPWQTHDANYRTYIHDCCMYNNNKGNIAINRGNQNKYAKIERIYGLGTYLITGDNVCIRNIESDIIILNYTHNTLIEKSKIQIIHFYGTDDSIVDTTIKDCNFYIENFTNDYYGGFLNHHTWQHSSINTIVENCNFTIGDNVTVSFDLVKNGSVMKNGIIKNCNIKFPGTLGTSNYNLPSTIIGCNIEVSYITIYGNAANTPTFINNYIKATTEDTSLGVFYFRYGYSSDDSYSEINVLNLYNNQIDKKENILFIKFRNWQNFVGAIFNIINNTFNTASNIESSSIRSIGSVNSIIRNINTIKYGSNKREIEYEEPGSMYFDNNFQKLYHTLGSGIKDSAGNVKYLNMDGTITNKVTII